MGNQRVGCRRIGVPRTVRRGERGASLVEFAIVAPLLILLLFGVVEFGWAIGQQVDLRSKAREATRIATVGGTVAEVKSKVCSNDLVRAANIVFIARTGGNDAGDPVTVTIQARVDQLTGLFGALWGADPRITSFSTGRVEQPADSSFANGTSVTCP